MKSESHILQCSPAWEGRFTIVICAAFACFFNKVLDLLQMKGFSQITDRPLSPVCLSRASVDGIDLVLTLLVPLFDEPIVCMSNVGVSFVLEVAKSLKLWWWIGVQGGGCFSFFFNREVFTVQHIMSPILWLSRSIGRLL